MLKKSQIIKSLVLIFSLLLFSSCNKKENISINLEQENLPYLQYSLQLPEYPDYPDLSEKINTMLRTDFENYKDFAQLEWEYDPSDIYTYRTLFEDHSNKDYINILIRKFIYCGPGMEDDYFITFCWDKRLNKLVTIEEVTGFTSIELMEYCRKYVKSNLKDVEPQSRNYVDSYIDHELNENLNNYSHFTTSKKTVTIYFASGNSAPKGFGPQEIILKK